MWSCNMERCCICVATEGEEAGRAWLANQGRKNIEDLNVVLDETATPWLDRAEVK